MDGHLETKRTPIKAYYKHQAGMLLLRISGLFTLHYVNTAIPPTRDH